MLRAERGGAREGSTRPQLAKIQAPRVSGGVQRRRLFRRLDEARRASRVVWVSAPAGSGKTYLLASYLAEKGLTSLWYQVDAGDGDLASFIYYFGIAVQRTGAPTRPLPVLTPEYAAGRETFLRNFFREAVAALERPALIVLDNYEEARTALDVVLGTAVPELPERLTLVALSRGDMPRVLARERAHGGVAALGEKDLRLDKREIVALARRYTIGDLDAGRLRRIQAETHGWFVGVASSLANLEKRGPARAEAGEREHDTLFDYFASTLFDDHDAATREFLLKTAFLNPMTSEAARHMTGCADAADRLDGLVRNHEFVVRVGGDPPVYRYHPLYERFLRARARRTWTPAELREVARIAAEQALGFGHIEAAVTLLHECDDSDALAELLAARASELLEHGRQDSLRRWLEVLPSAAFERDPWLRYWLAMTRLNSEPIAARPLLVEAYESFSGSGDVGGQYFAWLGVVNSFLLAMDDFRSLDGWLTEFERLRRRHPEFPSAELEREASAVVFCAKFHRCEHNDDVSQWAERALDLARCAGDASVLAQVLQYLAFYKLTLDSPPRVLEVVEELERVARLEGLRPLHRIRAALALAVCYDYGRDRESWRSAVEAGLELSVESGVLVLHRMLLGHLAWLELRAGNAPAAETAIARMSAQEAHATPWDSAFWLHLESTRRHLSGDLRGAEHFRTREVALLTRIGDSLTWHIARFQHVLLAIDQQRMDRARELLEVVRRFAEAKRGSALRKHCLLAEALICTARGDEHGAVEALESAFDGGIEFALHCYIVWPPRMLSRLCETALRAAIHVPSVVSLIEAKRLEPPAAAVDLESWPRPVRIYTLGEFRVVRDGETITFKGKGQKRPFELLRALVALGGRGVSVERVGEALWPDLDGDAAARALKPTLHRLRRFIGETALELSDGRLSLDERQCWVDASALARTLDRLEPLLADGGSDLELVDAELDAALQLYGGPFLGLDADTPWALPARERLRARLRLAIEHAAARFGERGDCARVRTLYEKGLALDEASEELYLGLMACHAAHGDRGAALRIYWRCRRVLESTLDLAPSEAVETLRAHIEAPRRGATAACSACGRRL